MVCLSSFPCRRAQGQGACSLLLLLGAERVSVPGVWAPSLPPPLWPTAPRSPSLLSLCVCPPTHALPLYPHLPSPSFLPHLLTQPPAGGQVTCSQLLCSALQRLAPAGNSHGGQRDRKIPGQGQPSVAVPGGRGWPARSRCWFPDPAARSAPGG